MPEYIVKLPDGREYKITSEKELSPSELNFHTNQILSNQTQPAQQENPIDRIFREGEQRRQAQALEEANASFEIGRFLKPSLGIPVVVSLILFALVLYRCFKTNKHSDPKKSSEFTRKSKTLMLKIMKILIFMGVIFCSIKLLGCFTGGHSGFYDSFDYYDGRR